eukprot:7326261-Prymnesium_polylepis.1
MRSPTTKRGRTIGLVERSTSGSDSTSGGGVALGACSWIPVGSSHSSSLSSELAAAAAPEFDLRRLGSLYGACAAL